jgi:uncharacterized repeat protein (TIGR03843 family)
MTPRPGPASSEVITLLECGELQIEGRLADASNATLRAWVRNEDVEQHCVIKPVAGERPLWDFPEETLTGREVASFALSEHLGWHVVPPTVWREDTPWGPGMCQAWIDEVPDSRPVTLVRPTDVPEGWAVILEGRDAEGRTVALAHRESPDVARLAVFDILVNNADRKGGHLLVDREDRLWGIDHGVTFAAESKLRTVLWGWAGQPMDAGLLADVEQLQQDLATGVDDVERWLDRDERAALHQRVATVVRTGRFPMPMIDGPAIPWPVF